MPRFFISFLLLFGAIIIGLLYLGPEWQRFENLRKETAILAGVSAELDQILANRDALLNTINAISQDDLARINKSLPQGPQGAEFLVVLERMAAEKGVVLKRVDLASFTQSQGPPGAQPKPSGSIESAIRVSSVKKLPVSMSVEGSYDSFRSFLDELERHIRLIDVEEISFSAPGTTNVSDFLVKAKTYYQ